MKYQTGMQVIMGKVSNQYEQWYNEHTTDSWYNEINDLSQRLQRRGVTLRSMDGDNTIYSVMLESMTSRLNILAEISMIVLLKLLILFLGIKENLSICKRVTSKRTQGQWKTEQESGSWNRQCKLPIERTKHPCTRSG